MRSPWFPRVGLGLAAILLVYGIVSIAVGQGGPQRFVLRGGNAMQELYGGVRQDGTRLGSPDAPVTIGVFNDLQCGPCRNFQLHVVDPLVAEYARGTSAQLEFHNFSLGATDTTLGAYAATAAGLQDREWQYIDLFFRNQGQAGAAVTTGFLDDIANAVPDLDTTAWDRDRGSDKTKTIVESDAKLATSYRLPAQPAVVVSGPRGSRTLEESPSKRQIDAAVRDLS